MTAAATSVRTIADLRDRRALVIGLARSGTAAARFLVGAGARVTAYDRRLGVDLPDVGSLAEGHVELRLGASPEEVRGLLHGADLVVTSPSISLHLPTTDAWLREALGAAQRRGVEIVSEVELFLRLTRARVLGVTGTKGKTTTTALIGAILTGAGIPHLVGGNIGRPLIEEVTRLTDADWAVLELSELQLPTITRGADLAVYTNVAADHLDRHASQQAYRAVKARLAALSAGSGRVLLNADDPGCVELGATLPAGAVLWYGLDETRPDLAGRVREGWLEVQGVRILPVDEVPLRGAHLLADVLAAGVAASLLGVSGEMIAAGIRGFEGVPHRMELIGEWGGVRWVNDSQATIPMAAVAGIRAFAPAPVVLIAGGSDKGLDYAEYARTIVERCRAAVLIGETAATLAALLGGRVPVRRAADMDDAVAAASAAARPGDVVLLAPAAASFDMFADYAARGDAFRRAVLAIRPGGGASA
ncbi:MAG TPA: UDP-N-acetylmuramoyl-L-alanine--D-glutamate ligase [Candidatus Limnocylindria bacterium]|nr:UDP-N-acetylmuramoyl-L-alanine--D-glutamate ligase [Candidatus Limnocylindria bacterium]